MLDKISNYLIFLKYLKIKRFERKIEPIIEIQQNKKDEKKDN